MKSRSIVSVVRGAVGLFAFSVFLAEVFLPDPSDFVWTVSFICAGLFIALAPYDRGRKFGLGVIGGLLAFAYLNFLPGFMAYMIVGGLLGLTAFQGAKQLFDDYKQPCKILRKIQVVLTIALLPIVPISLFVLAAQLVMMVIECVLSCLVLAIGIIGLIKPEVYTAYQPEQPAEQPQEQPAE